MRGPPLCVCGGWPCDCVGGVVQREYRGQNRAAGLHVLTLEEGHFCTQVRMWVWMHVLYIHSNFQSRYINLI